MALELAGCFYALAVAVHSARREPPPRAGASMTETEVALGCALALVMTSVLLTD
jgi:hypothetical protein